MKKKTIGILKVLIPTCVGVYLFWYFYDEMSDSQKSNFFLKITEVNYFWIVISLVLSFFSHIIRAHRWKYLLEPMGYHTSFWHRYHALMVGYVVNMVIPRAGEASRAGMLLKSDDVPFVKAFGTIIAERVIDVILLGIIGLITISFSYSDFITLKLKLLPEDNSTTHDASSLWLWLLGIVTVFMAITIVFFALNPTLRKKVMDVIKNLKQGLLSIFHSKNPLAFTSYSFLIWGIYILYFGICFFALDETKSVPINGILMAFIGGTIGIMITNGGVGVYPIFVGAIITFYAFPDFDGGVTHDTAYALATIIWVVQTLMMIVLGLISLFFFSKNFKIKIDNEDI